MEARKSTALPPIPHPVILPIFILFLCLGFVSCATVDHSGPGPQANQQPTSVASIDFYGTDLKFAWTLTNPYHHEIRLLSYVWELQVQGKRVQRAQSRQVRRIPPGGSIPLEIPVSVRREVLEKILHNGSLPSQLPYQFLGKVNLGAGVRAWGCNLSDVGNVNLLAGPSLDLRKFRITRMDESRAEIAVEISIRNPNSFPTKLSNFSADLILAGQTIAQEIQGPSREIPAGATEVVPLDLDLNFTHVGQVVYQALNKTDSDYTLYGKTDVSTPWGVRRMNYDQSGRVKIDR